VVVRWLPLMLAGALGMAQEPAAPPWKPPDSVRWAAADAARAGPGSRGRLRYLDLGAVPPAERPDLIQTLAGHLNSLSREPELVPPVVVPGTGGALLRINLDDYGWPDQIWESLAEVSPYHHARIKEWFTGPWPGGTWPPGQAGGTYYPPGAFAWERPRLRTALAPWLSEGPAGARAAADLVTATGSRAPIVSGPWFLWQTAIQEGRQPGYYDFLGIKDQKGFEKLVRFDPKLAKDLEQRRVVIFSGITQEPRRAERTNTVLGGLWRTFDSAQAVDKHNPLRVLNGELEYDVSEQIAPLPNGLPGFLLVNAQGARQNIAPPSVVAGDRASGKDAQLHVGLSCVRCHLAGKSQVIIPIDAVPIRALRSLDYDKLRELRRQYQRDLAPLMDQDRRGYAAALKAATGWQASQYATAYSRHYQRYDEAQVDAAWAGRDFGRTGAEVRAALARYDQLTGRLDPVLTVIANGGRVPIRQWQEAVPQFWTSIRGAGR